MNLCDVEMLGYFFKFYEFTENYLLVRFHTIDIKFSRRFPCRQLQVIVMKQLM